ncbi:hypothetical protein [Aeromicrobium endophyticum]|uniref:Uncharacterized protein n=1 Tax=Aeromicrobium endophyticum TaxID=2292704 RepID=A0A371P2S6_9ACTN|nr:hypothetical protein [Aeromicrobium endophyticum]REK69850.1 hypothetical protein DX116_11705 [Aeromicrobium endophyticum]
MRDAEGLDAATSGTYPPERNTWQFDPPVVSTGWRWLAGAVGVVGLLASGVLVVVLASSDSGDSPTTIDDDRLTSVIAAHCALMTSTVASLPVTGTAQRRSDAIRDQDRAIRIMLGSIRDDAPSAIRADRPAERWLRDWDRLVGAREVLAAELLRDPNAVLEVPLDADGAPLTDRMDDVWPGDPVCPVPTAIASADERSEA